MPAGWSPSSRRAWIEINLPVICADAAVVALLAEGVDRNTYEGQTFDELNLSPSSRRAWIEIVQRTDPSDGEIVALLAEGVDRNMMPCALFILVARRPPRGGRG